jgi:hypothetical protein
VAAWARPARGLEACTVGWIAMALIPRTRIRFT